MESPRNDSGGTSDVIHQYAEPVMLHQKGWIPSGLHVNVNVLCECDLPGVGESFTAKPIV